MTTSIGERLKKCRNEKGLSLRELAGKIDLSASFLSQIEQGKASPSIENLKKIANALDVRVGYLIEDEEDDEKNIHFIKKDEMKYLESKGSKIKIAFLLNNNKEKNMEPIIYEIGPNGESGRDFYSHAGEEFIFIIEGSLEIFIGEKKYYLNEGDSLYFKSNIKHRFKNITDKSVKALWVVSPPTF